MNLYIVSINRKIKYFLLSLSLFACHYLKAQVGIGTTSPDNSTVLDIVSSNKGVSIPNIELNYEGDAVTIKKPKKGLMVYHTGNYETEEGIYYNAGSATYPMWSKINSFDDLDSGSTIGFTSFTPINTANTISIGDIEVRYSKEDDAPQIRFTNLNQGESISYVTFVIQNWNGLNSTVSSGMCNAPSTFTTICQSNKIVAGEHNEIWIYFVKNDVYHAYNYQIGIVSIDNTLHASQSIELF